MTTAIRSEAARSVIVVNNIDVLEIGQDGSVSIINQVSAPSGNQILTAGQQPFTKGYTSAQQTWAVSSTLTLTHGLGVIPKLLTLELVCVTAEGGYTVGSVVSVNPALDGTTVAAVYGCTVEKTTTSLVLRFANTGFALGSATSPGGAFSVSAANWRVVARAWA